MSRASIMFAVASPGGVDPGTMEKAVQVSSALDADLELFYCGWHPARRLARVPAISRRLRSVRF